MNDNDKIDWKTKLSSRVFWLCLAAFLASISSGIAGIGSGNEVLGGIGLGCGIVSAGIYAAAEKATDIARIKSTSDTKQTLMTQQVSATSEDMYTVASVLSPSPLVQQDPVMEDE